MTTLNKLSQYEYFYFKLDPKKREHQILEWNPNNSSITYFSGTGLTVKPITIEYTQFLEVVRLERKVTWEEKKCQ